MLLPDDKLYELLHKKMTGDLLLPERIELAELLKQPHNLAISKTFEDFFLRERILDDEELKDSETRVKAKMFAQIKNADDPEEKKSGISRISRFYKYVTAAAILIITGFSVFILLQKNSTVSSKLNKIVSASTTKGSKTSLVLPDGTKVWVNSDSKLTYDENFGKQDRSVNLDGEAYFEVVKDPSRPFYVRTQSIAVKVLGTTFNVKAYPESAYTETTLIDGSVEVILKKDSLKKIILSTNEKLSIANMLSSDVGEVDKTVKNGLKNISITEIVKPANDSVAVEVQWTKNRLGFYNMKLQDVAEELSRWYNVEVRINGEQLKDKQYSGLFEGESVTEVVEALQLTGGFHYKIDKNTITISP